MTDSGGREEEFRDPWGEQLYALICNIARVMHSPKCGESKMVREMVKAVTDGRLRDYLYHPLHPTFGAPDKLRLEIDANALRDDLTALAGQLASGKGEVVQIEPRMVEKVHADTPEAGDKPTGEVIPLSTLIRNSR